MSVSAESRENLRRSIVKAKRWHDSPEQMEIREKLEQGDDTAFNAYIEKLAKRLGGEQIKNGVTDTPD